MTDTGRAILEAVIALPEDDLPRLAYADWLDEHGDDARAEFVRVQCGLARPARCEWEAEDGASCPQYNARRPSGRLQLWCPTCAAREKALPGLRHRERRLLTATREALTAELPTPRPGCHAWGLYLERHADDVDDEFTVGFARGFAAVVTLPCAAWLAHGPALVRAAPLERVILSDREPVHPAWDPAGEPHWWWVRDGGLDRGLRHALPAALFRVLVRLRRWDGRTGTAAGFPTPEEARGAASEACLCWARAAAVAPPPPAG